MQATILLLFNESLSWSIGIIQERTGLAPNLLMSLILDLIQSKIIQYSNINDDQLLADLRESDLQLDSTIQLSKTYRKSAVLFLFSSPDCCHADPCDSF